MIEKFACFRHSNLIICDVTDVIATRHMMNLKQDFKLLGRNITFLFNTFMFTLLTDHF